MENKTFTLADLITYLQEEFKINSLPETMLKQIDRFSLCYKMSAKEIARCVSYYIYQRKGKIDPLYGIWFVPNVRTQAAEFFKQLELDRQRQQTEAKKVAEYQDNNIIFNIKSLPHKRRKPKQLDLNEVDVKGESDGHNN